MNKQQMIDLMKAKYDTFIRYIAGLNNDEYLYRFENKWSGAQQLEHIVMSVKPLVQVFSMDTAILEQRFGRSVVGLSRDYDAMLNEYVEKLRAGGAAPTRYVPDANAALERSGLIQTLKELMQQLSARIEAFSEADLDSLLLPHPLLGNITLREMLYNAIYHVEHHQEMAKANLKHMVIA